MIRYSFYVLLCASTLLSSPGMAQELSPNKTGLTLNAAIEKAVAHSPSLQSSAAARLSSQGEHHQAGLLPNPELEITAENIGGQGDYRGFNSAEVTYGVSQLVEIGGKRSARLALSGQGMTLADYDYQAAKLNVIREVTLAFNDAVAASEEVALAQEQQKLASNVLQSVTRRVNAAREPLIQKSKANVALATSRIAQEKAEGEYKVASKTLANLMGEGTNLPTFDTAAFYTITPIAENTDTKTSLSRNPDAARWKPMIERSKAALKLEKANAIPDPRLNAGFRDLRESNDSKVFVAGISIPFPVFNRNQGNIEKAHADINKAESDQKATELELNNTLQESLQKQQAAYTQSVLLRDTILPEAQKAFRLSGEGYQAGKFAYLEVLDAQRTLTDARLQYIEALKEYHNQQAIVERLTAAHLTNDSNFGDHHE